MTLHYIYVKDQRNKPNAFHQHLCERPFLDICMPNNYGNMHGYPNATFTAISIIIFFFWRGRVH